MKRHSTASVLIAFLAIAGQVLCCLLPRVCGCEAPAVQAEESCCCCGCCGSSDDAAQPESGSPFEIAAVSTDKPMSHEAPLPMPRCGGVCFKAGVFSIPSEKAPKRATVEFGTSSLALNIGGEAWSTALAPFRRGSDPRLRVSPGPITLLGLHCALMI